METLGPFKGIYRVILGLYWGNIGIISSQSHVHRLANAYEWGPVAIPFPPSLLKR